MSSPGTNPARQRGLTLLETLAVIVLLSLAATFGLLSISAAGKGAERLEAISAVLRADARARIEARRGIACVMSLGDDRPGLALRRRESGEELVFFDLPAGVVVRLADASAVPKRSVTFDRLGRSPDYSVLVREEGQDSGGRVIRVLGATGMIASESEALP